MLEGIATAESTCAACVEESPEEEEQDGEESLEPGSWVVRWLMRGSEGENDGVAL